MRLSLTAVIAAFVLAACGGPTVIETPGGASSPTATTTGAPASTPTPRATLTPTPVASPAATPQPTPTPFGAAVFDDPDNCEHTSGAYRVAFPDAWWWNTEYAHEELGNLAACRYFAPEEYDITTASREQPIPDGVAIWMDYGEGGCFGFINPILEERDVTVDGFAAAVREFAEGKRQDNPPSHYQYMIELTPELPCESPDSKTIIATTGVDLFGDYEENKAILDRMMGTMAITVP